MRQNSPKTKKAFQKIGERCPESGGCAGVAPVLRCFDTVHPIRCIDRIARHRPEQVARVRRQAIPGSIERFL